MNKIRKWALWIAVFAAILGMVLSGLSTQRHIRIQREGLVQESYCAISDKINCDAVSMSSYSEIFGIPISWLGFLFYLCVLGMCVFAITSKKDRRSSVAISWFIACASVAYSIFLGYVSYAILDVFCIECFGMYVANLLLFVFLYVALNLPIKEAPMLVISYLKALVGKKVNLGFSPAVFQHIAIMVLVFIVGLFAIASIEAGNKRSTGDVKINELVNYFNEQSLYQLEVDPAWPVWGNPDAKVTIIEFSEFQCPFCKLAAFNVKPYLQQYKDDVRYYFVNYPLDNACNAGLDRPMHQMACAAAKAGYCANKKGDFWSYHDDVFRNQQKISNELLLSLAEKRGWNKDEFTACMNSDEADKRIKADIAIADSVYINSTPTIILNGRSMKYWKFPDFIHKVVQAEIKKAKTK